MKQILNIAYYEVLQILKDRILLLLVIFVPLLYAALIGSVYIAGILTDIPTAVVDLDHSKLSREVVTAFKNSERFKIIPEVNTYPELEQAMKNGTVRAGIIIPEDFANNVFQHRHNEVLTVYDGSNLIWGYNIRKYALGVITDFNIKHTAAYLAGLGFTEQEIKNTLSTVSCNYEVWYNPTFSYLNFLFMGMMILVIHQIGLLTCGLTVIREKEKNTWLQFLGSTMPQWKIFLGKALPYFIANFFNYGLLLWVSANFIHVKISGSLFLIFLLGLLFNIIIVSSGFFISVHVPNSLQLTRYIMPLAVPIFIISGYTWPQTHIPFFINKLAHLLPYTWMAEGFRMVTIKELGMQYVLPNILALTIMAILSAFLALTFTKRRKPSQEKRLPIISKIS